MKNLEAHCHAQLLLEQQTIQWYSVVALGGDAI